MIRRACWTSDGRPGGNPSAGSINATDGRWTLTYTVLLFTAVTRAIADGLREPPRQITPHRPSLTEAPGPRITRAGSHKTRVGSTLIRFLELSARPPPLLVIAACRFHYENE
jgi:hypothetical protein